MVITNANLSTASIAPPFCTPQCSKATNYSCLLTIVGRISCTLALGYNS